MPTRQTSSSGRPKSPRIQVVLPEDLCDRLALLADLEARTVSNMARVLIQQGVERLERLQEQEGDDPPAMPPARGSASARPGPQATPRRASTGNAESPAGRFADEGRRTDRPASDGARGGRSSRDRLGSRASRRATLSADQFRAELERQGQEPPARSPKPRRLRVWRPN